MKLEDLHIETERLIIRPYALEDALAIKQAIDSSLPELRKFMPWAKKEPQPLSSKVEKIQKWTKEIEEDKSYTLGLFDKDSGSFIGSSGFGIRNLKKAAFEIGYWVHTKQEKKGYITEALNGLCEFAFKNLKAERIEIHCDEPNIRSSKVAERVGFNHEFTYRLVDKDEEGNRIKDQVWFLFKEEWKV